MILENSKVDKELIRKASVIKIDMTINFNNLNGIENSSRKNH